MSDCMTYHMVMTWSSIQVFGVTKISLLIPVTWDSGWGDTLPETNMETQKGPYKDYSPSKRGLFGFPC